MTTPDFAGVTRLGWSILPALLLLSAFPALAGALRVLETSGGPRVLPANVRVAVSPEPLVVHVVAATLFARVGALQFHPGCAAAGRSGTAARAGCSSGPACWSLSAACG